MPEQAKPYVVVVGIDYSKTADLAIEHAFQAATERQNAEVHIAHVVQVPSALASPEVGVSTPGPDAQALNNASEELRKYADKKLQEYKQRAAKEGKTNLFTRAVSHLRLDAPAYELAQLASDLEADLIVVGTHGRRGASRLLLGSVAESTVRLAPCPVLVVRPKAMADDASIPKIEPPCPRCVEERRTSGGKELWCEQHRERHGRRHTWHYHDRISGDANFPLVVPE